MALAALISACRAVDDTSDSLRATLPLAGSTLLEHQARLAAWAGAGPIIILVERLPAALTAAVDRLRRDGLRVEIARGLADAVDRIHPDEKLLVIADGCVADAGLVSRMAEAAVPAMLTVPDDADHVGFERIDAAERWGGLLLADGARLRRTAAMLGDWDLESTLLRRAVQEAAPRIGAFAEGAVPLVIVDGPSALEPIDQLLAAGARTVAHDWPGRYIFPPIVNLAALPLLRRGVEPRWLAVGSVGTAWLAAPVALFGIWWLALVLLLASGPVMALAERLARVQLAAIHRPDRLLAARSAAAGVVLLLMAGTLAETQGWGCWLLSATIPAVMLALVRERRLLRRRGEPAPIWLASLDGLIWAFAPAALVGSLLGGMAMLAAYAVGSFGYVQHRVISED